MLQFPGDLGLAGHIGVLRRQAAIEGDRISDVGPFGAVRQLLPIKGAVWPDGPLSLLCSAARAAPKTGKRNGYSSLPAVRGLLSAAGGCVSSIAAPASH